MNGYFTIGQNIIDLFLSTFEYFDFNYTYSLIMPEGIFIKPATV